jgi:hypothetical protein
MTDKMVTEEGVMVPSSQLSDGAEDVVQLIVLQCGNCRTILADTMPSSDTSTCYIDAPEEMNIFTVTSMPSLFMPKTIYEKSFEC